MSCIRGPRLVGVLVLVALALSGMPTTGAIEGFVVLTVPPQPWADGLVPPLDVVAVHTGRPAAGTVSTLEVERVPMTEVIGTQPPDFCPFF